MQKLVMVIEADSGDDETDENFLTAVQTVFVSVMDLNAYGFTDEEIVAYSQRS